MPSLVRFGQLPDPMKKNFFFKFSKIRNSRNSQNSVRKPKFFPRQAIPKHLFALHSHYIGDTPHRVWFDLDNSLTRWKRHIFKTPFSRNSKSSVWKPNLFPRQAKPKNIFALHFHYTGDTHFRVWFDLDNSLTRWKRFFLKFSKIRKSRNSQTSVWKPIFFQRQAIPTSFLLYTLITLVILHAAFGLIWTIPWPDEKDLFLKLSKISNSRNSENSVWKPIFS